MKRIWLGVAMAALMGACSGGNPFIEDSETDDGTSSTVPADVAGDVEAVSYDPVNEILVVSGQSLDNTPYEAVYTRKPALDRVGYQAYTSQESSLGRHHTAYVKESDGAYAAVVMAGGQFGHVFAGAIYSRDGVYSAPDVTTAGGVVQYAGTYVGLINGAGDGGDLLPVTPGTPDEILPRQAAEIVGDIFVAADFADLATDGIIYNRVTVDSNRQLEDLELGEGIIATDGTFTGEVQQEGGSRTVGTYGGVFSGDGAPTVAGAIFAENHIEAYDNEFEHGIFVLSQCGTANADPVCNQPHP